MRNDKWRPLDHMYFHKTSLVGQVLKTKEYAPYINKTMQDRYIIRYLKDQNLGALQAKEIWKEIALKRWDTDVSDLIDGIFWGLWRHVSFVRWNQYSECNIYQEDIDAINSCKLRAEWQKRMLLCFLAQVRLKQVKTFEAVDFRPYAKLAGKRVDYISETKPAEMIRVMMEMGWVIGYQKEETFDPEAQFYEEEDDDECCLFDDYDCSDEEEDSVFDDELPQFDEYDAVEEQNDPFDYWKVTIPEGRTVIATLKSTYEVVELLDLIHCEKVCPECGSVFEFGSCSQTCLCPDCQKEKRREDKRLWAEDSREGTQIGIVTRVCEKCGTEFEAGARCQRKLCDKCYKLHIREVDRLRKQKM